MRTKHFDLDIKSLFKRGIKKKVEPFGCFLITGYMGSGKTYFAVKFANDYKQNYKTKKHYNKLLKKATIYQ